MIKDFYKYQILLTDSKIMEPTCIQLNLFHVIRFELCIFDDNVIFLG